MIERLLTRWPSLPQGLSAPLTLITLIAWTGAMVLVVRKATEQTALALTSELAAYGERARWSGIYYRGETIGFSVSQMTERPGGFKLQEDGQMLITLMGDSIASKLHTEVNVDPTYMLQDFSFSLDPGTGPLSIKGVLETPTRLAIKISSSGSEKSRTFDLKEPPVLSLNLPKRLLAMGLTEGARHQIRIFDWASKRLHNCLCERYFCSSHSPALHLRIPFPSGAFTRAPSEYGFPSLSQAVAFAGADVMGLEPPPKRISVTEMARSTRAANKTVSSLRGAIIGRPSHFPWRLQDQATPFERMYRSPFPAYRSMLPSIPSPRCRHDPARSSGALP